MFPYNITQTYTYPDGTKSTTEPTDGQVFYTWKSDQMTVDSAWQWDGLHQQWHRLNTSPNSNSKNLNITLPHPIEFITLDIEIGTKCECGSEKAGSNRHSSWCQKYTEQS